jgi:hypothetical protein
METSNAEEFLSGRRKNEPYFPWFGITLSPSQCAGLLGGISSYRDGNKIENKFHDHSADLAHWETSPPLDCDQQVVKPVPRPFVPGRTIKIQK